VDREMGSRLDEIRENGFSIFPERLSQEICDELIDFALTVPCQPDSDDHAVPLERRPYDPANPICPQYVIPIQPLITHRCVQDLMADSSMLHIAQEYIGSQPVLDTVAMWWSTSFSKDPSSRAAQLYHFDMDRIRWLKFFIYLTDVTTETGPHCFVATSHKRWGKPRDLLQKGYSRIRDEEIKPHYPADSFVEIAGPTGTIVAVDTCGFHKGKPLAHGHRLILQFEFSNSLFGASYEEGILDPIRSDVLAEAVKLYPRLYSRFRRPLL